MSVFLSSSGNHNHHCYLHRRQLYHDAERKIRSGVRRIGSLGLTLALLSMIGLCTTQQACGEEIVITSAQAPVQIREKIVAEVFQDERFEVLQRSGPWVAIEVIRAQDTIRGWVLSTHLQIVVDGAPIAPSEPSAVAPGLEFIADRLQVSMQGSRGSFSLQATVVNSGVSPVRYDVSKFRLLIDDREISATNYQQGGIFHGRDQLTMGVSPSGGIRTQWPQSQLLLSSGELQVGERIEKWLRFPLDNFARDINFAELKVVLVGEIGDAQFKIDLKRNAIEGLDIRTRASDFNPTVQVIKVHNGINALNYAAVTEHLPKDNRPGPQAVVLCQTPTFYIDQYVLEKLGVANYRPVNQTNPFIFVIPTDAEANHQQGFMPSHSPANLLLAATETEAALNILGGRPDTTALLIENADHDEPRVRAVVAKVLGLKIREPQALKKLIQATEDVDETVRSAAVMALAGSSPMRYGPASSAPASAPSPRPFEAVNAVADLMQDVSNNVRHTAILAAAQVNDPLIIQRLIDQLSNDQESSVSAACSSLGKLKAWRAVEPLQTLRNSGSRPRSSWAIRALGAIGALTPVETALAQLEQGEPDYSDFQTLKQNADERAIEPLIDYLESAGTNRSYTDQAVEILGQLGDKRAMTALIAQLRYGSPYSEHVPRALGQLKDPAAIEPLREAGQAANINPGRRAAIYGALLQLGDQQVFTHLMSLLKKPTNDMPIQHLLPILGNTEDPLATRLLVLQLNDAQTARYAVEALLQQGTPQALKALERKLLSEKDAQGNSLLSAIYNSQSPAKMELVYLACRSPNPATQELAKNYRRNWESQPRRPEHAQLVEQAGFPVSADAWINSPELAAADFEQRVVLLNFWAVWNDACLTTLPRLRQWDKAYAPDGLTVVGLTRYHGYGWDQDFNQPFRMSRHSAKDEIEALTQFADYYDLRFPLAVLETESELLKQYAVQGMPQMVLIDRSGQIRLIRVGSDEGTLQELETQIQKCLYEVDLRNSIATENDFARLRNSSIRVLNLQNSRVSDGALAQVPAETLNSLKLDGTKVSTAGLRVLAENGHWQYLRELSLSATEITDDAVEHLQAFPALEILHVAAEGITDRGLDRLTQMQSLKELHLGDGWGTAAITLAGLNKLVALPQLEHLGLNGLPLTDEALATLQNFPALQSIGLVSTKITAAGVQRLRDARPAINIEVDEWSGWRNREDYQKQFAEMARRGMFPLEVEGKLTDTGVLFRGHFVPRPKNSEFDFISMHGSTVEQFWPRQQSTLSRGTITNVSQTSFENQDGQTEYSGTWIKGRPESFWKTPQLEAQRAFESAVQHLNRSEYQPALDSLERATAPGPDHYRTYFLRGRILRKLDKLPEAAEAFRAGIEIIEEIPEERRMATHWGALGQGLYRLDRLSEARQALQRSIGIRNENAPTLEDGPRWWYFIMTLQRMGETQSAADYLKHLAPQVKESSPPVHQELLSETSALLEERS